MVLGMYDYYFSYKRKNKIFRHCLTITCFILVFAIATFPVPVFCIERTYASEGTGSYLLCIFGRITRAVNPAVCLDSSQGSRNVSRVLLFGHVHPAVGYPE